MKKIDINEMKKLEIEILNFVDKVCDNHSIKYSLDSGTLLGAVRHYGYIPWDDDIDIVMTRDNYEKFIDVFPNNTKYKLCSAELDSASIFPFIKVSNTETVLKECDVDDKLSEYYVSIDVFPIDNLPNDIIKRKKYLRKMWFLRRMLGLSISKMTSNYNLKHYSFAIIAKLIGHRFWVKHTVRNAKKYQYVTNAQYVGNVVMTAKKEPAYRKSIFDNYTTLMFEEREYPVVKDYDEYLKEIYGNYWELPPESERVNKHSFIAYYK